MKTLPISVTKKQFLDLYKIKDAEFEYLNTLVNDIFAVTTANDKFALKLYHTPYRTMDEVQWEIDLLTCLMANNAPISKPIHGENGYIQTFQVNGQKRIGVLFEWAPGEKPKPSMSTYSLLGKSAAQIHQASDKFTSQLNRERYDMHVLIDEQLQRMKKPLEEAGQFDQLSKLANCQVTFFCTKSLNQTV